MNEEKIIKVTVPIGDAIAQITALTAEMAKLKAIQDSNTQSTEKDRQQYEANKIVIKDYANQKRQLTNEVAKEIQSNNQALGAYQKMQNEYSKQAKLAKDLGAAVAGGNTSLAGSYKEAADKANAMSDKLKNVDKSIGSSVRVVGEYERGIGKVGQAFSGWVVAAWAAGIAFLTSSLKHSTDAALEAEKSMQRLSFAVKTVGGGSDSDLERLARQAEDLMGIFSHEEIEGADIKMKNFGLTISQISKIMPLMVDAGAASGKSLDDLATAIDRGVASGVKSRSALGQLGITFKDTGDRAENYSLILQGLTKFTGGNEAAMKTQYGTLSQLKIKWEEIQEVVGGYLLKVVVPMFEGLTKSGNAEKEYLNSRMTSLNKILPQQKNQIEYLNQEIIAEKELYKRKQEKMKSIASEIENNNQLGGAWVKNNKALKEESDGLGESVRKSIAYVNSVAGLRASVIKGSKEKIKLNEDENDIIQKKIKETFDYENKLREANANGIVLDMTREIEEVKAKEAKKQDELNKAYQNGLVKKEQYETLTQSYTEESNRLQNTIIDKYRDKNLKEMEKYLDDQNTILDKQVSDFWKKIQDTDEQVLKLYRGQVQEAQNALEIESLNGYESLDTKKRLLEAERQLELESAKKTGSDVDTINKKYKAKERDLDRASLEFKLNIASQTANSLAAIFGKTTKAGKAAASAGIAIDSIAGAIKAFNSMAEIPVVGPVLGAIAAAGVIATGVQSIKDVWAVSETGTTGISGGSSASTPTLPPDTASKMASPLSGSVSGISSYGGANVVTSGAATSTNISNQTPVIVKPVVELSLVELKRRQDQVNFIDNISSVKA